MGRRNYRNRGTDGSVKFAHLARLLTIPFLACGCAAVHADYTDDQVRQLEAFALKWERDAATLLSGDIAGGDRWERMGRAFGFQRAADDIRLHLNRPIVRNRANQPKPWPADDVRGTNKLMDLIQPGFGGVSGKSVPERERPALDLGGPP